MKIAMYLGIWIVLGWICAFLTEVLLAYFEHKCGYDWDEVDKIENELFDKWIVEHFYERRFVHRLMCGTIVPLIFWPYHIRAVEIENRFKAWEIYDNRHKDRS